MSKKTIFICLTALILSLGSDLSMARNGGGFGGGGGGGGGFHGNGGAQFHGGGQFRGNGGVHRGGGRFRDFHGRSVFIAGGPFFFAPFFYDGVYPYDNQLIYVQPGTNYSYYCRNPAGYYPDVQRCPTGWLQVAPDDPAY